MLHPSLLSAIERPRHAQGAEWAQEFRSLCKSTKREAISAAHFPAQVQLCADTGADGTAPLVILKPRLACDADRSTAAVDDDFRANFDHRVHVLPTNASPTHSPSSASQLAAGSPFRASPRGRTSQLRNLRREHLEFDAPPAKGDDAAAAAHVLKAIERLQRQLESDNDGTVLKQLWNENVLRNLLYHAQSEAFDLACESFCFASFIICEGFRRKWVFPGGEPLLLEFIPSTFLHIYRVLCVHKLKPSLSKTVIGHSYVFLPSHATLLAPSPLEEAMLENHMELQSRVIQVQTEPSVQWSASLPSVVVDCIRLINWPKFWQVLVQIGGDHACQLLCILEASFVQQLSNLSPNMQQQVDAQGSCIIRFDWLHKPKKLLCSSQENNGFLCFSSFRAADFFHHTISNIPIVSELPTEVMDVQYLRYSQIVESCLQIMRTIIGHAQVLSVVASEDSAEAVVSCFGVNALVQNKFLHDSMMMMFFGDKETPCLFDAIAECALRILKSLGWEEDENSKNPATTYETLNILSNNHLMNALNCCSALIAWMCGTIDGSAFVASDVRSVNLITRICLTGCCMVDPHNALFGDAVLPSFQPLNCISSETRTNALHAAVGALVALSRLISSELLVTKSISDDSLLLASWRLANSVLTLQSPSLSSLSGPDKLHENFLNIMYLAKFSQIGGKVKKSSQFDFQDTDKRIVSSVQPTPAAFRQVALAAYFEVMLAIKDIRAESLQVAENQDFTRRLGSSCANELRGLLCSLGWGVISALRIKGIALYRIRELLTPYVIEAGYHQTAFVPLQNVERLLLPPSCRINGEFVDVLMHWRRCGQVIDSYKRTVQPNGMVGVAAIDSTPTKGDSLASPSLLYVISILCPDLSGDNDCNFKLQSKFCTLHASIQTIAHYIRCSTLARIRLKLIAAANKIKYSAKRAIFNRYVGSKLLDIVRVSQPDSIWPVASKSCISWGCTAADIVESAMNDWKSSRRHVKRINTTTDRFYQGRTRLSMQSDPRSDSRNMVYTVPLTSPRVSSSVSEKAARGAGRSWNISSSDSEDEGSNGDSDDSCDSLGERSGIEKEDLLEGTNFSTSRMYMVSELPINAFTSHSTRGSSSFSSECSVKKPISIDSQVNSVEALDLSHSYYIERQLGGQYSWGCQHSDLKCQYLQRKVPLVTILDEENQPDDINDSSFSCHSSIREINFLKSQIAAAALPFGWSDVSQKPQEMNCIIMRKLCSRNQYHLSLLRSLRASQNVIVRMAVSSGFRKFRTQFAPLSRLATAINNHPQSSTMSIPPVIEIDGQMADSGLINILNIAMGDIQKRPWNMQSFAHLTQSAKAAWNAIEACSAAFQNVGRLNLEFHAVTKWNEKQDSRPAAFEQLPRTREHYAQVCSNKIMRSMLPHWLYGRRVSVTAHLKQLPPSTSKINDSVGWITDDVILLSLSLSVILRQNMHSISTPLLFQSMHLNCIPKVDASLGFFQSCRVFIPNLDPDVADEQQTSTSSSSIRGAPSKASDANKAKINSVLQHPYVQHKSVASLRSLDIFEWLQLAEQQLEAACSFETADIPHLILLKKEGNHKRESQRRLRWTAKDQWQIQLKSGFQSNARSNIGVEDIFLIESMSKSRKNPLQDENLTEQARFDPLKLLQRMRSQDQEESNRDRVQNELVAECARAESMLAAARMKKEPPVKLAALTEELLRVQRQLELLERSKEQLEWRKQTQAASELRAKKQAEGERLRSLRVLNTQNSLRQSWQQFIESLVSSCAFSVASIDHAAKKIGSPVTFDDDVKDLLRASLTKLVRVPVSQLKEVSLNRLTKQLIADRKNSKQELYTELASFTGGKPEDFVVSNVTSEDQWIADLHLKLQSLRSQEAIEAYLHPASAAKKSSIICAACMACIRLGRHLLQIHPPEKLKAIACFNFALRLCSPMSTIQYDGKIAMYALLCEAVSSAHATLGQFCRSFQTSVIASETLPDHEAIVTLRGLLSMSSRQLTSKSGENSTTLMSNMSSPLIKTLSRQPSSSGAPMSVTRESPFSKGLSIPKHLFLYNDFDNIPLGDVVAGVDFLSSERVFNYSNGSLDALELDINPGNPLEMLTFAKSHVDDNHALHNAAGVESHNSKSGNHASAEKRLLLHDAASCRLARSALRRLCSRGGGLHRRLEDPGLKDFRLYLSAGYEKQEKSFSAAFSNMTSLREVVSQGNIFSVTSLFNKEFDGIVLGLPSRILQRSACEVSLLHYLSLARRAYVLVIRGRFSQALSLCTHAMRSKSTDSIVSRLLDEALRRRTPAGAVGPGLDDTDFWNLQLKQAALEIHTFFVHIMAVACANMGSFLNAVKLYATWIAAIHVDSQWWFSASLSSFNQLTPFHLCARLPLLQRQQVVACAKAITAMHLFCGQFSNEVMSACLHSTSKQRQQLRQSLKTDPKASAPTLESEMSLQMTALLSSMFYASSDHSEILNAEDYNALLQVTNSHASNNVHIVFRNFFAFASYF